MAYPEMPAANAGVESQENQATSSDQAISPSSLVVPAKEQVSCKLGEDFVVLELKSCVYLGLVEAGATVWGFVRGGQAWTVAELLHALLEKYEAQEERVQNDLVDLLRRMRTYGLIEVHNGLPHRERKRETVRERGARKAYAGTGLTVYGTIEELTRKVGEHGGPDGGTVPTVRTHF